MNREPSGLVLPASGGIPKNEGKIEKPAVAPAASEAERGRSFWRCYHRYFFNFPVRCGLTWATFLEVTSILFPAREQKSRSLPEPVLM